MSLYSFEGTNLLLKTNVCDILVYMKPTDTLTSSEAAALLGVKQSRVRQLILAGRLPALKFGRDWLIERKAIEKFAKLPRPNGRPAKGPK